MEVDVIRRRDSRLISWMTSSHNPKAFECSTSSSSWVIDSRATDNATGIHSYFLSYTTTTQESVGIADDSYTPVARKGTIQDPPDLSLSFVLHIPCFSFNRMSVSSLTKNLNSSVTFYPYCIFQDLRIG